MRWKIMAAGFVALLAASLVAAACGGGDEEGAAAIRTQKGLAVAAVSGQLGRQASPAPGAPETGGGGDRSATGADLGFAGLPYSPALQASQTGITVQGYGSATADPDSAILEFYFSRSGGVEPKPAPEPPPPGTSSGSSGSSGVETREQVATPGQVEPITESDLQPVIDAIAGAGVPRDKIEFIGQSYYDMYYASATLRATVDNIDIVDAVAGAAREAAAGLTDIYLTSTNVSYTVSDCTALEKAAMESAVADANERGAAFAEALGVGLGEIVGASHYSYAPYGGTACDGAYAGPYPIGGMAYAEGARGTVQVFANVSITYAIQ